MDPSDGMIQKLESRGLYTNKYVEFVGLGQSTVPKGGFDLSVSLLLYLEVFYF